MFQYQIWAYRRCYRSFSYFVRLYYLSKTFKNIPLRRITSNGIVFTATYSLSVLQSSKSTLEKKLEEADSLFEDNKCLEILKVLEPLKNEVNDEVLWRLCRAIYTLSKDVTDEKKKKEMLFEALEYVTEALKINENNFAVHKWKSILISATSEYKGTKEKITEAYAIKKHMLRAVELNPKDATTFHLLGIWCFEVANMPWYQRKVANAIFAAPPSSSFEEALNFFIKAEEVEPHFYSMNFLMLGKTYMKLKNYEKAMYYLKLARDYPPKNSDDRMANNEAIELLKHI